MGNYFVKTIETGDVSEWLVCQRPKWAKEPVVVATKALVSDAESLAWELSGLNGGYFTHQPHEKAWAVGCVPITPFGGWVPIWKALTQEEAERLVIGLNNSEVFNHFSCELKDLGQAAKLPEGTVKERGLVNGSTLAIFHRRKYTNELVELEAGSIIPLPTCAHCGKPLPDIEGTYYERGLLCDECPNKVIDVHMVVHGKKFLAASSFLELSQMIHEKFGDNMPERLSIYKHPKTVDALYSISKDWASFQKGAA